MASEEKDFTRENIKAYRAAGCKDDEQKLEHRQNHHRKVWYENKDRELCITGWLRKQCLDSLPFGLSQLICDFRGPLFKWLKSSTDYR